MTIRVDSGPDELLALLDWFSHDDVLRGRVHPRSAPSDKGQMSGGVVEVLVVALGAGGLGSALMTSLTAWVTHRRSNVTITVTRGETTVELDAVRVKAPEVIRELKDLLDPPDTKQ
ncbi:hypothetical protein ACFXHA_43410 [Nocardia sp. NPDC059240]|uniref:effector-associated constant component EACC1 n=1 Tax=Nocardia sp. NPDC059240 TaxID=3346786 RepID=UPI00368E280A